MNSQDYQAYIINRLINHMSSPIPRIIQILHKLQYYQSELPYKYHLFFT